MGRLRCVRRVLLGPALVCSMGWSPGGLCGMVYMGWSTSMSTSSPVCLWVFSASSIIFGAEVVGVGVAIAIFQARCGLRGGF